jgi:hypothetical protein
MKLISLISSNPPEFKIEKVEAIGKENQLIDESFEKQKLEVEIRKHQPNLKSMNLHVIGLKNIIFIAIQFIIHLITSVLYIYIYK